MTKTALITGIGVRPSGAAAAIGWTLLIVGLVDYLASLINRYAGGQPAK